MTRESEFVEALRSASIKSAAAHLKVLQRLKELESAFWCEDRDDDDAAEFRADVSRREAEISDFLFDIARLHLNAYNIMLGASSSHTDEVVKRLRRILTPGARRQKGERARWRTLTIEGAAGDKKCASQPFDVVNPHDEAARVSLLVSKFSSKLGESFAAPVELIGADSKTAEKMKAGEERKLQLEVDLSAPGFLAGGHYDADAGVRIGDRIVKHLGIQVDVS